MENEFNTYFEENKERFISEWRELLAFQSISADPEYQSECDRCAGWLRDHLSGIGFEATVWSSATKPLVFAERKGDPTRPVVLFYGHYDVQPADPLDLWKSDPFVGTIRDGRMYARGAQDNKGQLFYFIKALEALISCGAKLPTVKLLIEGEEESASTALSLGLDSWRDQLKADILLVCDTGMLKLGYPAITMGLRGIAGCELRVHGPRMDLHSGIFGGVVANPLHALAKIVASLHNPDGSVAVPGFYDGVADPSVEEQRLVNSVPIDLKEISQFVGADLLGGEGRFTPFERRGLRPTLEINGLGGGYQEAGGKTVIPTHGMAKITMRLVTGQDPNRVLQCLVTHLEGFSDGAIRVEVVDQSVGGAALRLSVESDVVRLVERAVERGFGVKPTYIWEGASIPIIPALAEASSASPVLVGFGLDRDDIHSPNESFSLEQFKQGYTFVQLFLREVASA